MDRLKLLVLGVALMAHTLSSYHVVTKQLGLCRHSYSRRSSSRANNHKIFQQNHLKKRILSGVQPTGSLHLGNYLGAIKQWEAFQHEHDSFFCVVDLHAITIPQNPAKLRQETLQAAAMYIAAGIDPEKSTIFVQSHVSAHAEMTWLLNCITPMNWLERMIQYKEKALKQGENVGVGLFDYPVLMASDILLYQADLVPVGEDQLQHLELTRNIARRFNEHYPMVTKSWAAVSDNNTNVMMLNKHDNSKISVFKEPKAMMVKEGARVMSLLDGTSKMSKSAENDNSRINLLDNADVIHKKIKRCKTDSIVGLEWDNPQRPEATNLLNMLQSVSGLSREDILRDVQGMNWGSFKSHLAEVLISHLSPIQQRYSQVIKEKRYLEDILQRGQERAELVAHETLTQTKNAMGLSLPRNRKQYD